MREAIKKVVSGVADGTITSEKGVDDLVTILRREVRAHSVGSDKPNPRVTVLTARTSSTLYQGVVAHDCSFHEFRLDLTQAILGFLKSSSSHINGLDVFWHLREHCDEKYGSCRWEVLTMDDLRDALVDDVAAKE